MANDIQVRAHCQQCGREQAVRNGVMAKHGYTVEVGYFHGTCGGAGHPPIEDSRDHYDAVAKQIRTAIEKDKVVVQKLKDGKLHPKQVRAGYNRSAPMVDWADATDMQRRNAMNVEIAKVEANIRSGESWLKMMDQHVATYHKAEKMVIAKPTATEKATKVIRVGSKIKIAAYESTKNGTVVKNIIDHRAQGQGPALNGKVVPHVVVDVVLRDGTVKEVKWPLSKAKLV